MDNNLTYLIYSHTDFLDILKIASDYSSNLKNKILLINDKNFLPTDILSNFKEIITYDDKLPYASRLKNALINIQSEHILFTHEVDIILSLDESILNKLVEYMVLNNLDRIDLQPNGGNTKGRYIKISPSSEVSDWLEYSNIDNPKHQLTNDDWYLGHHTDPTTYIYNVNPSIWKTSSFLELTTKFKDKNYRDIEYDDVQNYCTKFKIYNLYTKNILHCGYYRCLPFYKYLHITHHGKLLRHDGTNKDEFNQSYKDVSNEYNKIILDYNLYSGKRRFS